MKNVENETVFIIAQKWTTYFIPPTVTKLTSAQLHYMQILYTRCDVMKPRCTALSISAQNAYTEFRDNPTQVQSLVISDGQMNVVLFQFGSHA